MTATKRACDLSGLVTRVAELAKDWHRPLPGQRLVAPTTPLRHGSGPSTVGGETIVQQEEQRASRACCRHAKLARMRHAHATHLLSSGVHPKAASERLGHSKVGITLDLYAHVLPGMQEDAAARVDDAVRVALRKRASAAIG
jgi:integrase